MRLLTLSGIAPLFLAVSCQTVIPDIRGCTVAGVLEAGADCATTNSGIKTKLTAGELIQMLESQPERPDPSNPGKMLPRRAGAVIMSAEDYKRAKDAQEIACRLLGNNCVYENAR